jgi:hypothetical protein
MKLLAFLTFVLDRGEELVCMLADSTLLKELTIPFRYEDGWVTKPLRTWL